MSTMHLERVPTLAARLGNTFFGLLTALIPAAAAPLGTVDHAAEQRLQRMAHFLIAVIAVMVMCLAPEIVAADGSFLPDDTTGFREDVEGSWTLVSYIAIFLGLVVMVVGMFLPIASWLKWGAIGAVLVGAFGQSVVEFLYTTGGNSGGITGAS